MNIISITISSW